MTATAERVITSADRRRLTDLARGVDALGGSYRASSRQLDERLARLVDVASAEVEQDIVTMNARVRLRDIDTHRSWEAELGYPGDSPTPSPRVSVLTQLGIELLGARVGDVIEWHVPGGIRLIRIEEILFQPEAAGEFEL